MRVSGSKRRVRLSEAELEPAEVKPVMRVAPLAAAAIWICSTLLATAIFLEWIPVRALFEGGHTESAPEAHRRQAHRRPELTPPELVRPSAAVRQPESAVAAVAPESSLLGPSALPAEPALAREAPSSPVATGQALVPSERVIRGSYYDDSAQWAAGW